MCCDKVQPLVGEKMRRAVVQDVNLLRQVALTANLASVLSTKKPAPLKEVKAVWDRGEELNKVGEDVEPPKTKKPSKGQMPNVKCHHKARCSKADGHLNCRK